MIENKFYSSRLLPSTYQTLSSFEQSLLHLASIIYEPVNRITYANCVHRAGITGPKGEWFTVATLGPFIQKLQDLELLDKDCRCPDNLVELFTRDAVDSGDFEQLAEAVQSEIPFSQYQSKWPQRCLRAMREYRIGLYSDDIVQLENIHLILEKQCRDDLVRTFPAVRFCNNPFDPDWLATLAPSLQFYLLSQMMHYSLHYLTLLEKGFQYLKSKKTLQEIPAEERLPFHRLLASLLLWRGNLDEADALIRENPQSFLASGMAGCLEFMLGKNDQALTLFESDLQQLKKLGSRKRLFFPGISGLFFVLALLKTGDIKGFNRVRKFIDTVRTQQPGNMLLGAYEMVDRFLSAQESGTADIYLDSSVFTSNSITVLLGALVRYWLSGYLPAVTMHEKNNEALRLLWHRAGESGFQWLAMEFAELIGRVEQDAKLLDYAAEIRKRTGIVSVIDAVVLEEPWRRRLKALLALTHDPVTFKEKKQSNRRIIWLVGYQDGGFVISAREQRRGADKKWSKGRPIALSRLYSGSKLDFMTDSDLRICKTLKREQSNQNVTYIFDFDRTLPAMVGHPLLF
ncbi:MAG: hypothetical protein ACWGOD_05700, partial [Desulfobulbales bacterium]